MKNILGFMAFAAMIVCSTVLTGCSSDDDETDYSEMIVGSWTNKVAFDDDGFTVVYNIRFYANGTCAAVEIGEYLGKSDKTVSKGTWSISGDKITIRWYDETDGLDVVTFPIIKMTATEMVVSEPYRDLTYTKIDDSVFEQYYSQE